MIEEQVKSEKTQSLWTKSLIISALVVSATSSFSFGYGIAAYGTKPSSEVVVNDQMSNITITPSIMNMSSNGTTAATSSDAATPNSIDEATPNSSDETTSNESSDVTGRLIAKAPQSVFFIGNMIGAFSAGMWYKFKFINRKNIFYPNHMLTLVSALFAIPAGQHTWLFYISRFIHGLQGGMACAITPVYLTEIAPTEIRGMVGFLHQLFITLGILFSQIIGLSPFMTDINKWTYTYLIGAIVGVIGLLFTHKISHSPVEQIIRFNDIQAARETFKKLRSKEIVDDDIKGVKLIENDEMTEDSTILQVIKDKSNRWQLILSVLLLSLQALSGINAIFSFADVIFKSIVSSNMMPYAILGTGIINVVVTILGLKIVDKFGRRKLVLPFTWIMALCHVVLTGIFAGGASSTIYGQIFSVLFILTFVASFAISLGPIAFVYSTEISSPQSRNSNLKLALTFNYLINIVVAFTLDLINQDYIGYVFPFFAISLIVGNIVLHLKMFETRNKEMAEIESYFGK